MNIKKLNEKLSKIINESEEKTFADWYGEDLTGQTYEGNINCQKAGLTSLEGCPKEVIGAFQCQDNNLTTLEGGPQIVRDLYCQNNKLIDLQGAPHEVNGYFNCSNNPLHSLEGIPEEIGILVAEGLDYKTLNIDIIKNIQVNKIMPKSLSALVTDFGIEAIIKDIINSANRGYYRYSINRRAKGTNFDNTEKVLGHYSLTNLDGRNREYKGQLSSNNVDNKVLESVKNSVNKRFNPFTLEINDYNYIISW